MAKMDLEIAEQMIDAGLEKAKELGILISFAITDSSGALVALKRMDGAPPFTTAIAENQAYSAALWRSPGERLMGLANRPWWISEVVRSGGRLLPALGALLIETDGEIIGATGVSGATAEQDRECALAALQALKSALAKHST